MEGKDVKIPVFSKIFLRSVEYYGYYIAVVPTKVIDA